MFTPQIIGAAIGLFIGGVIFWLVRRDHMVSKDGIRWLLVAGLIVLYGAFPGLNDLLGAYLGIGYPPIIPVLLGIGAVLIKLLINDTERVKTRVDIERMVQRIAILEAELEQEKLIRNNDNVKPLNVVRPQVNKVPSKAVTEKIEPFITESLLDDVQSGNTKRIEPLRPRQKQSQGKG